jgi:hypothetical protein
MPLDEGENVDTDHTPLDPCCLGVWDSVPSSKQTNQVAGDWKLLAILSTVAALNNHSAIFAACFHNL